MKKRTLEKILVVVGFLIGVVVALCISSVLLGLLLYFTIPLITSLVGINLVNFSFAKAFLIALFISILSMAFKKGKN